MYIKTALSNIRRSPFQALVAILTLSVTFFVATVIAVLIYSSAQVVNYFETRPQIIAFVKTDASQSGIDSLLAKIKDDKRVKDVKFVTKEDALNFYKTVTSDKPLLAQLVSPSIFPASIEFSVKDLNDASKIVDQIQKESVVDSVAFTANIGGQGSLQSVINRLTKIALYLRIGGLVLASILAITSFLVLSVIIGMRISSKKSEIETLRLMGATSGFIGLPIIFEAIIYVTVGVFIGWMLSLILVLYITPSVVSYFAAIPVLPKQTSQFFELNLIILGIELLVGFTIALFGGLSAMSRISSK